MDSGRLTLRLAAARRRRRLRHHRRHRRHRSVLRNLRGHFRSNNVFSNLLDPLLHKWPNDETMSAECFRECLGLPAVATMPDQGRPCKKVRQLLRAQHIRHHKGNKKDAEPTTVGCTKA